MPEQTAGVLKQQFVKSKVENARGSGDFFDSEPILEGAVAQSELGFASEDIVADGSLEATFSDGVIDISSQEHEDDREVTGAEGRADVFQQPSALVRSLLPTARRCWRGEKPDTQPPFFIFSMEDCEIPIPRGIAFHPQLVEGSFMSCHASVERHIRAILARRVRPLFYIGSTTDLIYRWRDLRDQDGRLAGHAFARNYRWHTMLAVYRTNNGNCCAQMEEALINTFNRKAFQDGHCQNKSMKALSIVKSSAAEHWVYVCLPKC